MAAASFDLDGHGMFAEGFLVLTEDRLGSYSRPDGDWASQWTAVGDLAKAEIVEGLGMGLLRVRGDGVVPREFRFTLRHAKEVARLHRRLERMLDGGNGKGADPDASPEEPPGSEDKKLRCDKCGQVIPAWSEICHACMNRRKILFRLLDFVRPYRTRAIGAFLLALLLTCVARSSRGWPGRWLTKALVPPKTTK